jgi:hypothetical protein
MAAIGIITLALFYVLQAPHVHGTHRWGTDPGESLGYANDLSGIVWALLLIPVAWAIHHLLPPGRGSAASFWLAVIGMSGSALAGLGLVVGLLSPVVEGGIAGVGSLLIVVWIGLVSRQARAHGLLTNVLVRGGQLLAIALVVSALLAAASFAALPHSPISTAVGVILALPGVAAYLAVPFWCGGTGLSLANRAGHAHEQGVGAW